MYPPLFKITYSIRGVWFRADTAAISFLMFTGGFLVGSCYAELKQSRILVKQEI